MFEHVIIGQYLPGRSILHRMDARAKLASVFFLIAAIFLTNSWTGYAVLGGAAAVIYLSSGVPFRYIRKGMAPIFLLVLFTFFIHALFTREGDVLLSLGAFQFYEDGVIQGLFIALRLLLLVFLTSLLTLTTSPIELTDAMEQFLSPLNRFRFPAHDVAMMMSIAIRFIPTLMQETEKIIKAQTARGADFSKGSLKDRAQAFVALLVPLFVRSFKRAEDLAYAMEARGYNSGAERTKLRQLIWKTRDTAACVLIVVLVAALFLLRE
ncbi:energy-coupling factor transport system permease protein [Sinobaca qinghaiensis]|uniref:Energy-coupling factor transporter transmembrane protein EcfT n=1 Tax=Sinobaca qinghaiensis TaxID=342944 RepID=A0A419UU51_9BACL|nr:energy-coupling factor transporter transmembrane component T [Sinobaca qinghaiensis]RKD67592.1 energy-coupling factor transport system permease protein [Sinobaca qinghaiensis]